MIGTSLSILSGQRERTQRHSGAVVPRRTRPSRLATVLGLMIALVAVGMWIDILGRI